MGEGARDTCPQAPGRRVGWRWSIREAKAVVHKADPVQVGSLGTPGFCAFLGHRSIYFLEGLREALSHTAMGQVLTPLFDQVP